MVKVAVKYFGVHLILPENAKYLAMDMGGDVWWFEEEPEARFARWSVELNLDDEWKGELITTIRFQPTPLPWWDTLKEVKDILLSKVS